MADDGTPQRWAVALRGDEWDLERFSEHLRGPIRVTKGVDGWELAADVFESMDSGNDVAQASRELVDNLRGLLVVKLGSTRSLETGAVLELQLDGSRRQHVYAQAHVAVGTARIHATGVVTYADGTTPAPAPPQPWGPILQLATEDARVGMAMAFLALPPTWHRLYAALDAPRKDRRTGGKGGVVRRGADPHMLNLFTWTANNYLAVRTEARHADPDRKAPAAPMTLPDAAEFVRSVVDAWIEELLRGREWRYAHD